MGNWQRLGTKIVYQNSYITVHEDNVITPDGKANIYGWVETPPGVFIVAIEEDHKVTLVKQLRYLTGQPTWELPGGSSDGQDTLSTAKMELEEEAGLHAESWVELSGKTYVWGGIATERDVVFIAKGLHRARHAKVETDDVITEVKALSWTELKDMIQSGELRDGQTLSALLRAGLHLGTL